MKKYELMFVISSTLTEEKREELIEKVKKLIASEKGQIETADKLGMKKLAYPIQFKNDGFYVLINFEALPACIVTLEKKLNITDGIIRVGISKK